MNQSKVLIILGSAQDEKYLTKCIDLLKNFQVPYTLKVASAHRSPKRVIDTLSANTDAQVILAFAGHAAHLAGVIAGHTTLPVVAVPLPTSDLQGLDSLLASVQMPAGVPVATMAIGEAGAQNAAIFATQVLALSNPAFKEKLTMYKRELAEKVEKSSLEVEKKWS